MDFVMGNREARSGNYEEAARLWMTAACLGYDTSMKKLMVC